MASITCVFCSELGIYEINNQSLCKNHVIEMMEEDIKNLQENSRRMKYQLLKDYAEKLLLEKTDLETDCQKTQSKYTEILRKPITPEELKKRKIESKK
jgi:hypothetical protein